MKLSLPALNKDGAEPIYLQLRTVLLQAIRRGDLQPHQRLPSERRLSELTDVSRMTIRQALQLLITDGWLYTVPGKGTFVAGGPKIEQNLQRLTGFSEEVRAQGFTPGSRVLGVEIVAASTEVARALNVAPTTPLIRIMRQRLVDGAPVGVETAHLVRSRFPGLDQIDPNSYSLYELLQDRYGVHLLRAQQVIEAVEADESVAGLLGVTARRPVLAMERITFAAGDQPVEYVRSTYRADRFRLKVELHGGERPGASAVASMFVAPVEEPAER